MGTKLFVGGLSWDTTDASLRTAFERFGEVAEARVILDRDTGRSRGFGFVTYAEESSVAEAMNQMNGAVLDGRSIRVNEAQERGGRGGRGGGGGRPRGGPRGGGGPPPVVRARGRGGSRPPGRDGPSAPAGPPGYRPPPAPDEESSGWGEDRQRRSERKGKTKAKKRGGGTGREEDFGGGRRGQRRNRRDSGRSWRDYTRDED